MAAGTNYRVFSPEVWTDVVRGYFKNKLYAAKFFEDWSNQLASQGGDVINMPVMTPGMTPASLTTTTGDITDYTFTETKVTLTVNSWLYASRKFSDFELMRIKNNYNLQNRYLRDDIAFKLANSLDQALIGQSGVAGNIQLHTGTSLVAVNNTAITECLRIAESYSMPIEEMAFFVHPTTYYGQLLRRTMLIDASQFGKPVVGVEEGTVKPLGSLYGRPVYVSNNVGLAQGLGTDGYPATARRNLFVHPRCLAFALGNTGGGMGTPRLQTQPVANALASRIVGDLAYGVVAADKYAGVRMMNVAG